MSNISGNAINAGQKYNAFLRLCYLGSLLHDIGKLDIHFIISKEKNSYFSDCHGQIIFRDRAFIPDSLFNLLRTPFEKICETPCGLEGFNLLNFICAHHGCERCKANFECRAESLKNHPVLKMLQYADRQDVSNPQDSNKQSLLYIKSSDFYGNEKNIYPEKYKTYRKSIYNGLSLINEKYGLIECEGLQKAEKLLMKYLSRGLSETRKWAHDIDIFSHSKSVALYLRLLLFDFFCRKSKEKTKALEINLRLLKVDVPSGKIGRKLIRDIECKFCLGSLIFHDFHDYYFGVSSFIDENDLDVLIFNPFYISNPDSPGNILKKAIEFKKKNILKKNSAILDLVRCFSFASGFRVLEPEDVKSGYDMKSLIDDILMTVDYYDFCNLMNYNKKMKSLENHIRNMKHAKNILNIDEKQKMIDEAYKRKENLSLEMSLLNEESYYINKWGWTSLKDATADVWKFLSFILSPIRPPSPYEIAGKWKSICKGREIDEEAAMNIILARNFHFTRFLSLLRDTALIFKKVSRGEKTEKTNISIRYISKKYNIKEIFKKKIKTEILDFFIFK